MTDRDSVVRAAAECFAEKGIRSTTVDDVAERAGVSRPTVYRHAGGKDDLVAAVLAQEAGALIDELREVALDATDLSSLVSGVVAAALRAIRSRPVLARAAGPDLREVLPDITLGAAPLIGNVVRGLHGVTSARPDLVPTGDLDEILESLARYVFGLVHTPTLNGAGSDPDAAGALAARIFVPAIEKLAGLLRSDLSVLGD